MISPTQPIPRAQRILYWSLVGGILLMFALLIRGCVHQQARILAMRDQSPIPAPNDVPDEPATIAQPNETDGSVSLDSISLPLPEEPSLRAKALLTRMLGDLAQPASPHPVPAGPSVTDVFLLSLPLGNPGGVSLPAGGGQLAVVNLDKAFADAHPSGIQTEDLTLRAIVATLHANFPQIQQVRFLVAGQPRDTLNGHADLSRAYSINNPADSIHVVGANGEPLY